MRWRFTVIVCILLLLTMLPIAVSANGAGVTDRALDFTLDSEDPDYPGLSGEGWAWDTGSKTLTLSGVNIDVGLNDEEFAVKLPDGAKINLEAGTVNGIVNDYAMGILCCDGSLVITGGGDLNLVTNGHGIRASRDLTIDMTGKMDITVTEDSDYGQNPMGLRVGKPEEGGNLVIRNCNTLTIDVEYNQGVRVDGDVSISDCGRVTISAPGFNGIRNFGGVSITGCNHVAISGYYNGIRSAGDVLISGCPDIQVKSIYEAEGEAGNGGLSRDFNGIYSDSGSVTVTNSALTVYGAAYGIATGPTCDWEGTGGDVIINHSCVRTSCSPEGYAAIFAGDDLPYGEGEHARIVLNGCVITSPSAGLVLDVNIEQGNGDLNCQSITDLDGTWIITSWDQAVKDVTIEPLAAYTLTYDANGGSGSVADANSPYSAGATVTVLPSAFTAPAGKTFTGWNTKADGSGTAYAPGATFAIAGNTVLYAQYSAIPVFTVTFDSQGGGAVAALTVHANSTINAPAPPVRSGHTFGGWYKDKECKNAWNFATDRITGNTTLYARWTLTEPTPPSSGQGYTSMGFIIAGCLLGGLFLLIRHRQHA